MAPGVHVFGVRHHGPGSARSLALELAMLAPDAVLIEAPPEATAVAALALEPDMVPPVALLAYSSGEPQRAAFWPLAVFSPEWQAMRIALAANTELRFIDLPAANMLALDGDLPEDRDPDDEQDQGHHESRPDPLGLLAAAGGFEDPESWWEDVVEHGPRACSTQWPKRWPHCARTRPSRAAARRRERRRCARRSAPA